jgi:hypothetical protein
MLNLIKILFNKCINNFDTIIILIYLTLTVISPLIIMLIYIYNIIVPIMNISMYLIDIYFFLLYISFYLCHILSLIFFLNIVGYILTTFMFLYSLDIQRGKGRFIKMYKSNPNIFLYLNSLYRKLKYFRSDILIMNHLFKNTDYYIRFSEINMISILLKFLFIIYILFVDFVILAIYYF